MLVNYDAEGIAEVMGLVADTHHDGHSPGLREEAVPFIFPAGFNGPHPELSNTPGLSPSAIERVIEGGLPRDVLRRVAERIAGTDKAKVAAIEWGIVPKTTLERRGVRLSPQESERTERVARLFVHARRALGTEGEARDFMMTPHPELDARSPVEAARTDLGTRRVEQVLNALEYGLVI